MLYALHSYLAMANITEKSHSLLLLLDVNRLLLAYYTVILTRADGSDLYHTILCTQFIRSPHRQVHWVHTREHRAGRGRWGNPQGFPLTLTDIIITANVRHVVMVLVRSVHPMFGLHVPVERFVLLTLVVAHLTLYRVLHLVQMQVLCFL